MYLHDDAVVRVVEYINSMMIVLDFSMHSTDRCRGRYCGDVGTNLDDVMWLERLVVFVFYFYLS